MMAGGSGPIPRSGRLIKPPSTGRLIAILAATEDRFLRVELTLFSGWVTKAGRWQIAEIQRGRTSQKQILEPLFRFR